MDGSEKRRLILLDVMKNKNISPQELSQKTGIDYTSIMQFRNGDKKLNSIPKIEQLAFGLGEPVTVFFPEAMTEVQRSMDKMKQEILESIKTMSAVEVATPPSNTAHPFSTSCRPLRKVLQEIGIRPSTKFASKNCVVGNIERYYTCLEYLNWLQMGLLNSWLDIPMQLFPHC